MLQDVSRGKPDGSQQARAEAIKAIERRRRFWTSTIISAICMAILIAIWAITEYHNAGGWPTNGFSQSSGQTNVWNIWIIYPLIAWVLLTAFGAWSTYWRRPISEGDINREIERQSDIEHH
jgi:H+/Cl- antiporter ClcA